jgi:hypothetical protein
MSVRGFSDSTTISDSPERQAIPSTSHGQLSASWLEGNKINTHPPFIWNPALQLQSGDDEMSRRQKVGKHSVCCFTLVQ